MGNEKANSYWEAELPPNYDRVGIENFIRAKYVKHFICWDILLRLEVYMSYFMHPVNMTFLLFFFRCMLLKI